MRLFIAVDVSSEVVQKVSAVQEELKASAPSVSVVPVSNLHLTLKFLGEVSEGKLEVVKKAVQKAAKTRSPFPIAFHSVGVFPSEGFVSVVWVGIGEGDKILISIMEDLEKELSAIRKEPKAPHPHLTIARVSSAKENKQIVEFVKKNHKKSFGACTIGELVLYQSELKPTGTVYTPLSRCKLG